MPTKTKKANKLFPGRPGYVGPKRGYFGLLHHDKLYEYSYDVTERIQYVKRCKSPSEKPVRLHNMIYLGGSVRKLIDEYIKKFNGRDFAKTQEVLEERETAKTLLHDKILEYIKKHIPDCAWNGKMLEMSLDIGTTRAYW